VTLTSTAGSWSPTLGVLRHPRHACRADDVARVGAVTGFRVTTAITKPFARSQSQAAMPPLEWFGVAGMAGAFERRGRGANVVMSAAFGRAGRVRIPRSAVLATGCSWRTTSFDPAWNI